MGAFSTHPFVYCQHNPVKFIDTNSQFINMLAGGVVGGIVGAVSAALSGDNTRVGTATGAATDAMTGVVVDVAVATGGIGGIAIVTAVGGIANAAN